MTAVTDKKNEWDILCKKCMVCTDCTLHKKRTNVVFGVGKIDAALMFVGEGPGEQEDLEGEPFVGAAGKLFTKMLNAIALERSDVYIANIVKCRPERNRDPLDEEKNACIKHLHAQIELVEPKIIVCLGRIAAQALIQKDFKITSQRGQWFDKSGISFIATYHPSALLRDETKKLPSWNDFKTVRDELRNRIV